MAIEFTRQRVIGLLLLFSTGSAAGVVYLRANDDRTGRPAAGGEQSGTGTVLGGTPDAPSAPGAEAGVFAISGRVGGLVPGVASTLPLRVTNPNPYPIRILTLDTGVTVPDGTACPADTLRVASYDHTDGAAVSAPANGTVTVGVRVVLTDSPTADQSGCAGATFPLTFTGTAVESR